MMEVLASAMVAIAFQYVSVSNQHIVHLKLCNLAQCQCYLSKARKINLKRKTFLRLLIFGNYK